jgi:hypothetical protein
MPRVAFADESGTDQHCRCYSIGAVSVPTSERDVLEARVTELKAMHGIVGEAKWTRIRNSHGAVNFVLDCLDLVLTSTTITFDAIVVNKQLYRNWQGGAAHQEVAFYKTYTYLLRHIVRRLQDTAEVLIDERSDRYGKRDEAMRTIGNHMLGQLASKGQLGAVTKVPSHETPGVQLADILTGAINTGHLLRLQTVAIHPGKHLALERLAMQLQWPHIAHDTYPHERFNVWHFPQEFRGPSRNPGPRIPVPYVTADDLRKG